MALFQLESSSLDRYLSTPETEKLKNATDEAELLSLGMTDVFSRFELYDLLSNSAEALARARLDCLSFSTPTFEDR